ncbi:hypothetical protein sos41_09590 [Alphaproteobacteria bacterium SO-S41]|nr:hypothetical protein sos41_09590 [Alphaproteobacteria bacterium SO-S41]
MSFAVTLVLAAAAQAAPPAVFVLSPEGERMVMERVAEPPTDGSDPPPPAWTGVKKGEPYRIADLKGLGAAVTASDDGGALRPGCAGEELPTIPFDTLPAFEEPIMLVPGTWPAMPKTITPVNATEAWLLPLIAAGLKAETVKNPAVKRGTALKADLNGDGVDETIFSVSNMEEGAEKRAPGEYTLLAVEWVKDGKSTVVPLATQAVTAENADYGEVNWDIPQLVAIADFDGDGAMEVVAVIWGYEQMDVVAWSFAPDGTPHVAYTTGCAV